MAFGCESAEVVGSGCWPIAPAQPPALQAQTLRGDSVFGGTSVYPQPRECGVTRRSSFCFSESHRWKQTPVARGRPNSCVRAPWLRMTSVSVFRHTLQVTSAGKAAGSAAGREGAGSLRVVHLNVFQGLRDASSFSHFLV